MANRKLRVHVERTFNRYNAGDELLVEDTAEVQAEITAGLLRLVAVEEPPPAKAKPKREGGEPSPIPVPLVVDAEKPAKAKAKASKKQDD